MNCWVIDSQSNSGPDYCYRVITVIIAPDDKTANKVYLEKIDYPIKKKYLNVSTEDLGELIWGEDPEEYYSGAGWDTQCNEVMTYSDVPSNEVSIKQFEIQIEGLTPVEFYTATKDILLELSEYYKKNIGQDSPYSFSDFVDDFLGFVEEDETFDYLIDGISIETLLGVMKKRGLL